MSQSQGTPAFPAHTSQLSAAKRGSAVNRLSRGGQSIGADQRVTPMEALQAMTINVAHQYGEQASKGSLEAGRLADLVILDLNPLKVDPMKIKDVRVVETIKEGRTIYREAVDRKRWSAWGRVKPVRSS